MLNNYINYESRVSSLSLKPIIPRTKPINYHFFYKGMTKSPPQIVLLFFISIITINFSYSQDFDVACLNARPFCSDASQELTFPNQIDDIDGLGEVGCLNTTPNPAWYFIRIQEDGDLVFDVLQWVDEDQDNRLDRTERQLDVDFIAWGPFETSFIPCDELARGCDLNGDGENLRPAECVNNVDEPDFYPNELDNTNIVDCSYARIPDDNFIETLNITNAVEGQFYFVLITNFANESGAIQLQQTNLGDEGAGTTDCSILEPGIAPENIATCGEFPITVEGRFPSNPPSPQATGYRWFRSDIGTNNFTLYRDLTPNGSVEINGNGIYQIRGYTNNGNTEVPDSPDEVAVLDVSTANFQINWTIAEESFAGSYTITAEALFDNVAYNEAGFTDFEYRLEREIDPDIGFVPYPDSTYQSSPIFNNVPPGDYRVIARYKNCEQSELTDDEIIMILGYPKYFTPNGDGTHDDWHLINVVELAPSSLIYIFDRHGKLLKQLQPGGNGWDGTYNGRLMPSTEYWFKVEFNEPTDPNMRRRVFAGSFALIR